MSNKKFPTFKPIIYVISRREERVEVSMEGGPGKSNVAGAFIALLLVLASWNAR